MLKINFIIFFAILIFTTLFFITFKANSNEETETCLTKSFITYKNNFLSKDGRVIDPDKNNITTSEGQSYIMLRSVTMGDEQTFDLTYKWAKNNLQRSDKLFAWLWGESSDGKYKILDDNSASDADIDIAFALIIAYEKWGKYQYLQEALPIINAIWNNETKRIDNYLVLMPGVEQTKSDQIEVNPSYFSPYAFRFFQKYDELHDWNNLIDSSYYYLNQVSMKTNTGLFPNWFLIKNGQIVLEDSSKSDFSYDAVRVFIRIYLDYVRTGEKRALPILEKSKFFISKWKQDGVLYVNYQKNGELRDKDKFVGSIAILIPAMNIYDPETTYQIYSTQVDPYFQDAKYWEIKKDYYAKNLLWFGCYLYDKNSNEFREMHKRRIIGY